MSFTVFVHFAVFGFHTLSFNVPGLDNKVLCEFWVASNATHLHGALSVNGRPTDPSDPLLDGGIRSDEHRCVPSAPSGV